jgi:hypothetical protein
MRGALGFVAVHFVLAAPGTALLFAVGVVKRPRQILTALGPAYLCGIATVMPILILVLVAGAPVRLPHFVLTSAVAAIALAAVGVWRRRRAPRTEAPRGDGWRTSAGDAWVWRAAAAAAGLYFAVGATAFAKLATANDDMAIWSFKALAFFQYDGALEPRVIVSPGPAHLDYPVLQPLLESLFFRAMGNPELQEWHIALWILFGCFVWTVGFLMRSAGAAPVLLAVPVGVLALAPGGAFWVATGYADITVACFVAAAALAFGLWLNGRPDGYAVLAGAFLAAGANVKNEGVAFGACLLVACAVVVAATRSGRWRGWVAAAVVAAAGALPWIAWRASRGLSSQDVGSASDSVDPGLLGGRLDRLWTAAGEVLEQLGDQGRWSWIVPCFLAVAVASLWTGEGRRLAAFYLGSASLMTAALLWVYWTGSLPVANWLAFSANRVVASVVFVSAAGLTHLVALALREPGRAGPSADPR